MATRSILKNVDIRDKKLAKEFINALENSKNKRTKEVVISKTVKTIDASQIKEIFGNAERV